MTTFGYSESGDIDDLMAFSAHRAVELAGITARKLLYWDFKRLVQPSIRRRVSNQRLVRLYNFEDMIALLVTAHLRRRGYSLQHVRRVVEHLRSRGYDRPLSQLRFATAGREIYFQHPDGSWEGNLQHGQRVISEVIDLDLIRTIIRRGVARSPEDAGRTDRRRGRLGRKPVFAGTRIPVEAVVRRLAHGFSAAQVIDAYPDLTLADIEVAREYAASH